VQPFIHVFMNCVAFLSDHSRASIDLPSCSHRIGMNVHIALTTATVTLLLTPGLDVVF
jgi:hypothetical protein